MVFPIVDQLGALAFAAPLEKDGKISCKLTHDGKKVQFNLCRSRSEPVRGRYRLDEVREGEDGARRGLTVELEDWQAVALLQIDEAAVKAAVSASQELFGKRLTAKEVRERHEPLVREKDGQKLLKFKVKTGSYATRLLFADESEAPLETLEDDLCDVVPILSAPMLWRVNDRFGVCLQAEAMIVHPRERDVFEGFAP